jgi:hypothetical protein
VARQVELQDRELDRLLDWIRAVDAKTPVVMAIDTAMLGIVIALLPLSNQLNVATLSWIAIGSSSLVLSLLLCAVATFPQTGGPLDSLIFFEGIAARTLPRYAGEVAARSAAAYFQDLTSQCHRNAQIASHKYRNVRRAILWLLVGIGPWLASLYVLTRGVV